MAEAFAGEGRSQADMGGCEVIPGKSNKRSQRLTHGVRLDFPHKEKSMMEEDVLP